jgi:glycosyltransferase involved in cell wall biosynthesis
MNTKKVSVIVPVYNAEKYVSDTIQSLLAQTYENFEVIIVDDGSPDRSIEICRKFTDSRIKIVQQPNRGLAGARNTGIRQAQGDYLSFIDADDLWTPEKLEKHVKHLNSSPSVGVSFSYSAFIDELGQNMGLYQIPRKIKGITPPYILCRNPIGNGSAAVFRREVFENIRFQDNLHGQVEDFYFDEHFRQAEDVECWLRIAIQTDWKTEGVPEVLTLYRLTSGGLSASALKQYNALEKLLEKVQMNYPDLYEGYASLARAYYLRYTARRGVTLSDGAMAVQKINQAVKQDWRILIEEPHRTLLTFAAAYVLWLTPKPVYKQLELMAYKLVERNQKRFS